MPTFLGVAFHLPRLHGRGVSMYLCFAVYRMILRMMVPHLSLKNSHILGAER